MGQRLQPRAGGVAGGVSGRAVHQFRPRRGHRGRVRQVAEAGRHPRPREVRRRGEDRRVVRHREVQPRRRFARPLSAHPELVAADAEEDPRAGHRPGQRRRTDPRHRAAVLLRQVPEDPRPDPPQAAQPEVGPLEGRAAQAARTRAGAGQVPHRRRRFGGGRHRRRRLPRHGLAGELGRGERSQLGRGRAGRLHAVGLPGRRQGPHRGQRLRRADGTRNRHARRHGRPLCLALGRLRQARAGDEAFRRGLSGRLGQRRAAAHERHQGRLPDGVRRAVRGFRVGRFRQPEALDLGQPAAAQDRAAEPAGDRRPLRRHEAHLLQGLLGVRTGGARHAAGIPPRHAGARVGGRDAQGVLRRRRRRPTGPTAPPTGSATSSPPTTCW